VVVESNAAEFFEARVLEIESEDARVQVLPKNDIKRVALSDLYRVADSRTEMKAGAFAICRVAEMEWMGCRIQAARADAVEIFTVNGKTTSIPRADVLTPSSVTQLNLEKRFERTKQRSEFESALGSAAPRAPAGYRPDAGALVLVRVEGKWYSAKVFEIDREDLRVRWPSTGRINDVDRKDVVPSPPYPTSVKRGEFVLVRPLEPARAWPPARVERVDGTEIAVKDAEGSERQVTTSDIVPLVP
jgi:hypothetical protein